jgi:formate hydrogenlyase subunit 6/NADH:ubiquinone oxidoreductase subunit I
MARSEERRTEQSQDKPERIERPVPLHAFIYMLPQILRTLVNGPSTVSFPFGPLSLPASYRGRVEIDAERCRGCSLCVRDCPANALELRRESRDVFQLIYHPDRCAYCGQCELSCNFGAIRLSNSFTTATTDPSTLTTVLVDRKAKEDEDEAS